MEDFVKRLIHFVLLILLQVLVLNHIHLFHYATPLLFVYFLMRFPFGYPRWAVLLWGFFMGIILDMFTNTPGVTASAMTIMALITPYIMRLFVSKEDYIADPPSLKSMGIESYYKYAATYILISNVIFFTFEMFNLVHFGEWILRILCSSVITLLFALILENFNVKSSSAKL